MLLLVLSGFVIGTAYLWIKIKVWQSGTRIKFDLSHDAHLFSRYRQLVKRGDVSLWPLYLYWMAIVVGAMAALALIAALHK